MVGMKEFLGGIKRSLVASAVLLAFDVGYSGSLLMSSIFCPIWFLVSLLKNVVQRPGWRLALVRILLPALTFCFVRANDAVQRRGAETNAQRVVAACEAYHAANGRFPKKLDELVPQYMSSVPVAKHCLAWGNFVYSNSGSGSPMLFWFVVPPHYRRIYDFDTRRWSHLD